MNMSDLYYDQSARGVRAYLDPRSAFEASSEATRKAWEHICYMQPAWFVKDLLALCGTSPAEPDISTEGLWDWAIDAQPSALNVLVWDWYRDLPQFDTDLADFTEDAA